jgi:hypothetical protein
MCAIVVDDSSHAHLGNTLQQTLCDHAICLGDATERACDGQDTIMYTRHNLGNAGTNASLIAQVSDILSGLANDDTSFLG